MIRLSTNLMTSTAQLELSALHEQLYEAEVTALTGLEVTRPSDAPSLMSQIEDVKSSLADQEVYAGNIDQTLGIYSVSEQALDEAHNTLTRAMEIAVQMSSETYDSDARVGAADEVDRLLEELVALANTEYAGRYVFAGTAYDSAAFDDAGTYLGSSDVPSTAISTSSSLQTGFDGGELFTGTVDSFGVLTQLSDALRADDPEGVADLLDDLQLGLDQLVDGRERMGHLWNQAEDAQLATDALGLSYAERLDSLVAADPTEAYTELANLQTSYEAALSVSGQLMGQSLFDYIR